MSFARPWTAEEEAVIRANYRTLGARKTAALIGRSYEATAQRASKIGAQKDKRWTSAEDGRLQRLWGTTPISEIARIFGRPLHGVLVRAAKIGLKRGPQRGMERLDVQARRTGFSYETLQHILKWAGVQSEIIPSCTGSGNRRREGYCDVDVDDAVKRWLEMETVGHGARVRGIGRDAMERVLLSGRFRAPRHRGSARWRVPSTVLDEAAEYYRSLEPVDKAARRHRVVPGTLLRWLRRGGITKSCHPRVLVEPAIIDKVVEARRLAA